jgi:GR25 family glycosyltransferase involved in LPS biosynthesis
MSLLVRITVQHTMTTIKIQTPETCVYIAEAPRLTPNSLHAYVISLPTSVRRATISDSLRKVNVPWSFFDGLTNDCGSDVRYDESSAWRYWGRPLTGSEVGCAASHIAVMNLIAAGKSEWGMILEDDVLLDPGFDFARLPDICNGLELSYLRLYATIMTRPRHIGWVGHREVVRFRRNPMGAQAYIISKAGATAFLSGVKSISRPVDWEIPRYWHNGLANYALFPFPVIELASKSSIVKRGESAAERPLAQTVQRFAFRAREYCRRGVADYQLSTRDRRIGERISTMNLSFVR